MTTHDTECPWRRFKEIDPETDCQFCPALKRARADERERDRQRVSIQMIRQDAVDEALADLRAKVIALAEEMDSADPWWREHAQTFDAVLALLEEKP